MATCDLCGEKIALPYKCKHCGGTFCPKHRLPENHSCEGLDELSEKVRKEGRIQAEEGEKPVERVPTDRVNVFFNVGENLNEESERRQEKEMNNPFTGSFGLIGSLFSKNACTTIIIIMFLVGIIQLVASGILGSGYYEMGNPDTFLYYLAPSRQTIITRPWTLVTSIFAHGSFSHLFINAIVLFFLGPVLEARIRRKKFISLFLGAGIIAGIAQLLTMSSPIVILGASGAIFGVLGALTILSPRLPILLFFFIPMQLWMLTIGYGALEAILAFTASQSPIAHMAHFAGLLVGLIYGYKLKREEKSRGSKPGILDKYHW
ncbi:MAG: rhomboid family intramembrane serine protease [Hadesarchaea archaeon]|nr:rhomboid family intramembrane serine protease [Hadesarchaea archaeon]